MGMIKTKMKKLLSFGIKKLVDIHKIKEIIINMMKNLKISFKLEGSEMALRSWVRG